MGSNFPGTLHTFQIIREVSFLSKNGTQVRFRVSQESAKNNELETFIDYLIL